MNNKAKKLNKQNNNLDKKIKKENQEVFTDMICYLRASNLSDYDIELVRYDLSDMLLSAQERGENIEAVIGGDYKKFCDEVIASIPPKTKLQKIIDFLDICCYALSILFTINILISKDTILIIENAVKGKAIDFNMSVTIGNVISILLTSICLKSYCKYHYKKCFQKRT